MHKAVHSGRLYFYILLRNSLYRRETESAECEINDAIRAEDDDEPDKSPEC